MVTKPRPIRTAAGASTPSAIITVSASAWRGSNFMPSLPFDRPQTAEALFYVEVFPKPGRRAIPLPTENYIRT